MTLGDKNIYRLAFCGKMGAGKTQASIMLAGIFQNLFGHENAVSYVIKFANPLYLAANAMHQIEKPRTFLQRLSDLAKREFGDDIFRKIFEENLEGLYTEIAKKPQQNILIMTDDLRYKAEYELLKRLEFTVIRIDADEEVRKERIGKTFTNVKHRSEMEIDLFTPDFILDNNIQDDTFEIYYNKLKQFIIDTKVFGEVTWLNS